MRFFGSIEKKYLLFLAAFISGMLLLSLFGSRGLVQIYKLKEERNRTRISNARLQEENRKLSEQIHGLRNNKEEVEKAARELGWVRKGELVYQFEK